MVQELSRSSCLWSRPQFWFSSSALKMLDPLHQKTGRRPKHSRWCSAIRSSPSFLQWPGRLTPYSSTRGGIPQPEFRYNIDRITARDLVRGAGTDPQLTCEASPMVRSHWLLDPIPGSRISPFGVLWRAAVLYLGLATALPTSVRSLGPHSKAARDYAAAMQLAKAFRRADTAAATGGESIILVHGTRTPRAFVLFHGLTNSPRQFRKLAATLYDSGDNVFVPRLPQQALRGADADDLGRLTAEALRDVGDAAIDLASGLGDTVVVLGLSLGGDVAAWTAQFRPEVDRAVIVAPTLGLAHVSSIVATPMMNLTLRVPNYSKNAPPDSLRPDRTLGWSTRAVGQMLRLGAAVRRAADKRAPAARVCPRHAE